MNIIIPTYRRAQNVKTLKTLAPEFHKDVTLVVRPEEVDVYRVHGVHLDVLPDTVKNLAGTRQYIWDRYKHLDTWMYMDDDITGFSTVSPGTFKQTALPLQAQTEMFSALKAMLSPEIGAVSPRPSWQIPHENRYPIHRAAFVTGFYMFNGVLLRDLDLRFDRFHWAGDTDFVLQLLSRGIDTQFLCTYKYSIDIASCHFEGDEFIRLAAMYPKYIRPRKAKPRFHYSYKDAGPKAYTFYWANCLKDARRNLA